MQTIPLWKQRALLQVGVETFNLTNRARAEGVSEYLAAPGGRLGNYGTPLESAPARQVQLLVQLEY
jgi:hypothetical protein